MPDENKKSRWDYLGKEPAEFVQEQKPTSAETAITEEMKITKEWIGNILQRFATEQKWTFLQADERGNYEFKAEFFADARLIAWFAISSGGTTYLNFNFLIGAIEKEVLADDFWALLRMNSSGFGGSPFFLTAREAGGHKFLGLEWCFVIPKDASDEAILNALHGGFGTLFASFIMAPWEKMMKMGLDIFLFPENMQRK